MHHPGPILIIRGRLQQPLCAHLCFADITNRLQAVTELNHLSATSGQLRGLCPGDGAALLQSQMCPSGPVHIFGRGRVCPRGVTEKWSSQPRQGQGSPGRHWGHQHCSHPSPPTQPSCRDSTGVEPGAVLVQQRETEPKTLTVTTSALQTQSAQLQICPVANHCRAPARHLRSRQGCCEPCGTPITREHSSSAGDGGKQLLSPLQVTCCLCSNHSSCTKASRGR